MVHMMVVRVRVRPRLRTMIRNMLSMCIRFVRALFGIMLMKIMRMRTVIVMLTIAVMITIAR